MSKIEIYEYQLKQIEDTLRMCANALGSHSRATCLDRDVMLAWNMAKTVLNDEMDVRVTRLGNQSIELKGE